MGLISRALAPFQRKNRLSSHGTLEESQFWSELSVNHPYPGQKGYLQVMAALRAGMVIAQGIGQMPLHVKHTEVRDGQTFRRNAIDDRTYKLLNRRPNDWMTSVEWREAMTLHAVFTGVGRSIIRRGVDGRALEILPLHPRWVNAYHDQSTGEFVYEVGVAEYGIYGKFSRDDIIEITNPRWDLVHGMDISKQAAGALGLSGNLEARQSKLTSNTAPYGIISATNPQSAESVNKFKAAWVKQFGQGNGIGIIDFDAKFQQMVGTAQDQQTIENRKFQIGEVGRAYGVFPAMMMESDNASTFASAQEFFSQHIVHTMRPWRMRWEQAIDRSLFDDRSKFSAHLDENGLFRMSPIDRAEIAARSLGSGGNVPWKTVNEVREDDGLDPIDGGDKLVTPSGNTNESPSVSGDDGAENANT